MKTVLAAFVVLGTIYSFWDTVFAIKCFNCNSYHQPDCADWFDNVTQHLVNCFDWQTRCRKVVQEVWVEDHWDVRYIRQCAGSGEIGPYDGRVCQERYGSYNVRMRYCHCDNQDGCNAAPPALTPATTQYLLLLLTSAALHVLVNGSPTGWCMSGTC
ncbi:uncharacterized protein LOC112576234 [Pomacea canaliculata]|uniref:uncharacterized protein LOC112576234 n=1 Tax=Pomacea canaliculata TaxID=400727 RepID=UPI000D7362BF|nr:uncharacterized protein LOC112576234 [Pomacea canaliculata]